MRRLSWLAAAAGSLIVLGCSAQDHGDTPIAAGSGAADETVAATTAASSSHRVLAAALKDSQLAPVLDGKDAYTLLAPTDAAFEELGAKQDALSRGESRPLLVAVLRAHILPGEVTPQAIDAAIARQKGPVSMRTMAGNTVRFSKTERGIAVSNGSTEAALVSTASTASNGAVVPIDKVLLPAGN